MPTQPGQGYPLYHSAIVSMAPDKAKTLTAADMETLCEIFLLATGVSALSASKPLADIWRETNGMNDNATSG